MAPHRYDRSSALPPNLLQKGRMGRPVTPPGRQVQPCATLERSHTTAYPPHVPAGPLQHA